MYHCTRTPPTSWLGGTDDGKKVAHLKIFGDTLTVNRDTTVNMENVRDRPALSPASIPYHTIPAPPCRTSPYYSITTDLLAKSVSDLFFPSFLHVIVIDAPAAFDKCSELLHTEWKLQEDVTNASPLDIKWSWRAPCAVGELSAGGLAITKQHEIVWNAPVWYGIVWYFMEWCGTI